MSFEHPDPSMSTFFFFGASERRYPFALREIGGSGGGAPQKKHLYNVSDVPGIDALWRSKELGVWGRSPQKKNTIFYVEVTGNTIIISKLKIEILIQNIVSIGYIMQYILATLVFYFIFLLQNLDT